MTKRILHRTVAALLCLFLLTASAPVVHAAGTDAVQAEITALLSARMGETDSLQALLDSELAETAGTGQSEWFAIAAAQAVPTCNLTAYAAALERNTATATLRATDRQRIALVYAAAGVNAAYIQSVCDQTIGQLGIMSQIYGLLLLDAGAYQSNTTTRDAIIEALLQAQLTDGGWALYGTVGDVDVTAMAMQALAPYMQWSDVEAAMNRALTLLAGRQLATGDYASWGTPNAESTAQVLLALCALGISPRSDTRFCQNGVTLLDGLGRYCVTDGQYAHTVGGIYNLTASTQVLCAYTALWRMEAGMRSLYRFTDSVIPRERTAEETTQPLQTTVAAIETATTPPLAVQTNSATECISGTTATEPVRTTQTETMALSPETTQTVEQSTAASAQTVQTTAQMTQYSDTALPANAAGAYKPWAMCGLVLAAGGALLVLRLRRRVTWKNTACLAVLTAGAMLFVQLTTIQSADAYYALHPDEIRAESQTVTFSIRCDSVAGEDGAPVNGIVLPSTAYVLRPDDTVYTLLVRICRYERFVLSYKGTGETAYICGISGLYEFGYGNLSGWIYTVNGQQPSVGCGGYAPADGDEIIWHYSRELGKDVTGG